MRLAAVGAWALLGVVVLGGCQPPAPEPASTPATPPAAASGSAAPAVSSPVTSASSAAPLSSPSAAAALPKPSASALPTPSPSPSPGAVGARVINFDASDYAFSLPSTISAGTVTLVMRNVGQETHHAQLFKLNPGVSLDQFTAALAAPGPSVFGLVSFAGGTGALDPGSGNEEVTLDVQEGEYVAVCLIQGPDGVPHFLKGMLKPITVTAPTLGPAVRQPSASQTVAMRDFAYDTQTDVFPAGRNTWRVTNTGLQPHELQVARLDVGATPADIVSFFSGPRSGPPRYTSLGGLQGIAPNADAFVALDLAAGDYAFYCAIPDPTNGLQHLREGMIKQVTVR